MIKKYRLLNGFTQEQLAEKLEISTRQLQRLEKGSNVPSFWTLQKLVFILHIPDNELANYIKMQKKECSS